MIQIRNKYFETNSSSTHCLVITTEENWKLFKENKLAINLYSGKLDELYECDPKIRDDGRFEYEGEIYDNIYDIDPRSSGYCYYSRDHMLYDALEEEGTDTIIKSIDGTDKLAVSIYCYES